jgi:hexosaminidase
VQGGNKDQASEAQIRAYLTTWRDNDAKLHTLLDRSFLLEEVAPLSADLSALGAAGLQALDYLDKSQPVTDSWRTQQLAVVEGAKKRKADLLLMVAAPVQQLIEGAANPKPSN